MRVGFEITDLFVAMGGVQVYAARLLEHLAQLGELSALIPIDSLHLTNPQESLKVYGEPIPAMGCIQARRLPLPLPLWQRIWWRTWPLIERQPAMAARLAEWLLPYHVTGSLDVCHWSDRVFLPLRRTAHVTTVHDVTVLIQPEWHHPSNVAAHKRKLAAIAQYATRLIVDSENTRRDVINHLGLPPDRIDVIPLAAGPGFCLPMGSTVKAVLDRYRLHDGDYIIYVGTIEPRKNVVRLATAFKMAIDREPQSTMRLVLGGKPGWLTEPIEQGLMELGLNERLVMPGPLPQEDLPALLHGARAMAYVSLYEGFGLPPLEAMACGAPVIASNNSSIPEVVGDAGLLVDPYDVKDIALALHRVITDDALRADLAMRSVRRAAQFSWIRTAELTLKTYRHAAAMHATGRTT